ncbi:hypothetical protein SanaruYs_19830 [Chryseotalea sanaruensis]|uniref:Uncharacterized protein n=1 Tax=Chryseotalea sanaruensis TaxID=2482724 RepID=A0A401UA84_9BACT|nr:hypothetical protein [Chryseotalea sanaruensis]GCC51754.1 hypothetical protein SanaruYs_19830 [Chryseotalea sanaruensis]
MNWTKEGEYYNLSTEKESLLKLKFDLLKTTTFQIGDQEYIIEKKGFWQPYYLVHKGEALVATLRHDFWGSKGRIELTNQTTYQVEYKFKNTLTLRFLHQEQEILSYHVETTGALSKSVFRVGVVIVEEELLLVLAAMGMTIFLSIFNEFKADSGDASVLIAIAAM